MELVSSKLHLCAHCGNSCDFGSEFCCSGCETVYQLLADKKLLHFYRLKEELSFKKAIPIENIKLEIPKWESAEGKIYLEGIHCLGCLWIIEKIPQIVNGVISSRLDFRYSIVEVVVERLEVWPELFKFLATLGYKAKFVSPSDLSKEVTTQNQKKLIQIGVAGFCAGNIMLMAISIYAGASSWIKEYFTVISALLALPVLSYSAWPIYRTAFGYLRNAKISVDLPIAIALISGALLSFWNIYRGNSATYFDSLSMLVFLLMSSRFFLETFRQRLAKEASALHFYKENLVKRESDGCLIKAESLVPGDVFSVEEGQVLPVDAEILSKELYADLSLLSGESKPIRFLKGDRIDSGAKILDKAVLVAITDVSTGRMGQILSKLQLSSFQKSAVIGFADTVGSYFTYSVLIIATALVLWFSSTNPAEGFSRALALLVVSCPCVLAFAIPLSYFAIIRALLKRGILVKDPSALERVAKVKKVFLDKTGTLTLGQFTLQKLEIFGDRSEILPVIVSMERNSRHPVAKELVRSIAWSSELPLLEVVPCDFGLKAFFGTNEWKICKSEFQAKGLNIVDVFKNNALVARATLSDSIREDSRQVISNLRELHLDCEILSGDTISNVTDVARELGIPKSRGNLSPEDKAEIVKSSPRVLMVGDGYNDSLAIKSAMVGIAVNGGVEIALTNADFVLNRPGIADLELVLNASRKALNLIKTNFGFTLFYNLMASFLAIIGWMTPLLAAIIMPLSAFTVMAITFWQIRRES